MAGNILRRISLLKVQSDKLIRRIDLDIDFSRLVKYFVVIYVCVIVLNKLESLQSGILNNLYGREMQASVVHSDSLSASFWFWRGHTAQNAKCNI